MKAILCPRIGFAFIFILGLSPACVQAQPGSLDTNFNAVTIDGDVGYSLAVQSDGRIIAVGSFGLKRFLPNGSLDPSFKPVPRGIEPRLGVGSGMRAVALQTDGRILVTGAFTNADGVPLPILMRLNADGSIDPSFDLDSAAFPDGHVLAMQPDGKILTGGYVANPDGGEHSGLMRLRSDGSLDPQFDLDGFGGATDFNSLALARDGKIYLGMFSFLARLHPDGTYDPSFNPAPELGPYGAIAIQPDGKVLVGQYGDGPSFHSVRRLLDSGADDPEWQAPAIDGGDHVIYAILVQPDGKVLVGGNNLQAISGVGVAGLGRLNSNGSLDTTFNTRSDLHYYSVEQMALAPSGRICVAGSHSTWPDLRPAPGVWRLNNDSELQPRIEVELTVSAGITLRVRGIQGATYRLETREQGLGPGNWSTLATLTLNGPTGMWQDAAWTDFRARFYRAVSVP